MINILNAMILSLGMTALCFSQEKPAFDEKKELIAQQEWNRDINVKNAAKIEVVLNSAAKKNLVIVSDRTYQALKKGDAKGIHKEDIIADLPLGAGETRSTIALPAGHHWFIIKNESNEGSTIQMQWFPVK